MTIPLPCKGLANIQGDACNRRIEQMVFRYQILGIYLYLCLAVVPIKVWSALDDFSGDVKGQTYVEEKKYVGNQLNPQLGELSRHSDGILGVPYLSEKECGEFFQKKILPLGLEPGFKSVTNFLTQLGSINSGKLGTCVDYVLRSTPQLPRVLRTVGGEGWEHLDLDQVIQASSYRDYYLLSLYLGLSRRSSFKPINYCNELMKIQAQDKRFAKAFGIRALSRSVEWEYLKKYALTASEQSALIMYTNYYSAKHQTALFESLGKKTSLPEDMKIFEEAFNRALKKLPSLAKPLTRYQTGHLEVFEPGKLVTEVDYMSTSADPNWNEERYKKYVLEIETHPEREAAKVSEIIVLPIGNNSRGHFIGDLSIVKQEGEVTFERNTCFLTKEKEKRPDGSFHITIQETPCKK